jgi:hypothetical protein
MRHPGSLITNTHSILSDGADIGITASASRIAIINTAGSSGRLASSWYHGISTHRDRDVDVWWLSYLL